MSTKSDTVREEDVDDPTQSSSGESEEEEEDENAREWTEEAEKSFLRTLSNLKKKDPKIYDKNVCFFADTALEVTHKQHVTKKDEEMPMYLRDFERKIILEKGGVLTDEEDDEGAEKNGKLKLRTYADEQHALKEQFKHALNEDDDETDEQAGFLVKKVKSDQEKAEEEEDYLQWLKGRKTELEDKEMENELKFLKDYWSDPNLNEGEQFLRDYILNKRYLDPNDNDESPSELEFSEEEKMLDEHEEYEQKYNFRFEEPDKEFIKTYPRVIENSLRHKNEKRKLKREAAKKKKEQALEQKRLEVKKLQKQKQQELTEKIKKLKQITGNKNIGFDDFDIEEDFNPDAYDTKMAELFDKEFYDVDEDEKPKFSESDEEDIGEYDDSEMNSEMKNPVDEKESMYPDVTMECDVDNTDISTLSKFKRHTRSSRKKGHKKSKLMEQVNSDKPVFDPKDKTFDEYLNEYYGLEFEDVIGDMPCRFKYKKVAPNDFGLTIEEILAADDKELNQWCSMKKIDTIRQENIEKFEQKFYAKKGRNLDLKKKILPSLFKNENDDAHNSVLEEGPTTESKQKKRKHKNNKDFTDQQDMKPLTDSSHFSSGKKRKKSQPGIQTDTQKNFKKPKQFGKKFINEKTGKNKSAERSENTDLTDERLKAYGINPKKYKNKLKYGRSK